MSIETIKETHGAPAAMRVLDEVHAQHSDLGLHESADEAKRTKYEMLRQTHVVVGDHPPEPKWTK